MHGHRNAAEIAELLTAHLDASDDPTTLIVKAHLLLESQLHRVVWSRARHPKFLRGAKLTFFHCLCLARAGDETPRAWFWQFVEQLNSARNRFAHELEAEDPIGEIRAMLKARGLDEPTDDAAAIEAFRDTVAHVFGLLEGISYGDHAAKRGGV